MVTTAQPFLAKLAHRRVKRNLRRLIRTHDDPILSTVCDDVVEGDDLTFIETMKEVLAACDDGVGLAAPQIGIAKRVILLAPRDGPTHFPKRNVTVMINPEIIAKSEEKVLGVEGCLSYPNISQNVERHRSITVRWHEPTGLHQHMSDVWHEKEFMGWESRIISHEIDHLNGVCLVGEVWKDPSKNRRASSSQAKAAMVMAAALAMGAR